MGLLIQISKIEIGRLLRHHSAISEPRISWPGIGKNAQNSPIKKALDTECRLR